jgi:3-dehydroquinate synthase
MKNINVITSNSSIKNPTLQEFLLFCFFSIFVGSVLFNNKINTAIFCFLTVILSLALIVKKIYNFKNDFKICFKKNSYKIFFENYHKHLKKILENQHIIIVCDQNLNPQDILQNLSDKKPSKLDLIILTTNGESVKQFETFKNLTDQILNLNPTRNTILVAYGGGSVGDLVGFCASVILRGIRYIQYPTTLLAMVDSSVGGKTAINTETSKNMIGSFYQPICVICDTSLLSTLCVSQFLSGYGEVVKYGLMWDSDFFNFLIKNQHKTAKIVNLIANTQALEEKDRKYLNYIIKKCCKIKAKIVSMDEFETKSIRELLNFGHTIGHGIEKCSKYKNKIPHGQAVACAMIYEIMLSGDISSKNINALVNKLIIHYKAIGFFDTNINKTYQEISIKEIIPEILQIITKDKKNIEQNFIKLKTDQGEINVREFINCVVLKKVGKAKVKKVNIAKIAEVLSLNFVNLVR